MGERGTFALSTLYHTDVSRLLDVYWPTLRLANVQAIRAALDNTL